MQHEWRTLAVVLVAATNLNGCAGLLLWYGYPGVIPEKELKEGMTRVEVEQTLGCPYGNRVLSYGRLDYFVYYRPRPGNAKDGLKLIGYSALTGFLAEIVLTPLVYYGGQVDPTGGEIAEIYYDVSDRVLLIEPRFEKGLAPSQPLHTPPCSATSAAR